MIVFLILLLIVLEILGTYFFVQKLVVLNKKTLVCNEQVVEIKNIVEKNVSTLRIISKKVNKILKFIVDFKLYNIKKIITTTIGVVQLIGILKSVKATGFNVKNVKKIVFADITRKIASKVMELIGLA